MGLMSKLLEKFRVLRSVCCLATYILEGLCGYGSGVFLAPVSTPNQFMHCFLATRASNVTRPGGDNCKTCVCSYNFSNRLFPQKSLMYTRYAQVISARVGSCTTPCASASSRVLISTIAKTSTNNNFLIFLLLLSLIYPKHARYRV